MQRDDIKAQDIQNQINFEKLLEEQLLNSQSNERSESRLYKESVMKVYNIDDKLSTINEMNVNYENDSIFQPK